MLNNARRSIQDRLERLRVRNGGLPSVGGGNQLPDSTLRSSPLAQLPSQTQTRTGYQGPTPRPGSILYPPSPIPPSTPYTTGSGPPPGQRPGSILYPMNTPGPPTGLTPRYPETPSQTPAPTGPVSPYGRPLTGPVPREQWDDILARNPTLTQQIRNAYLSYYGQIPGGEGTLVGLLNKIYNEGYPVDRIMQMIREEGYSVPDILQQAADLVQLEYGPQQAAAERAIQEIMRQLGIDINTQHNYGQIYDESISRIYNDLQTQLSGLASQIPGIWNNASEQGQAAYGNALSGIQSGFDSSVQRMQENAAGLGIEAALDDTIAQLAQSIAPNQQALANEQGSVGTMFSGLGGVYGSSANRLQQIQASEGAQQRGNLANQVLANIGGLQRDAQGAVLEQQGIISDLGANRGTSLRSAYEQLENQQYERGRQEMLDALAQQIQQQTLAIQQGQLGVQQGHLDLDRERFQLERTMQVQDAELQNMLITAQVSQIYAQIRSMGVQDEVAAAQIQTLLAQAGLTQAQIQETLANVGLIQSQAGETAANTGLINATAEQIYSQILSSLGLDDSNNPNANTGFNRLNSYIATGPGAAFNQSIEARALLQEIITGSELWAYQNSIGASDPLQQGQDVYALGYRRALQVMQAALQREPRYASIPEEVWNNALRAYFGV